MNIRPLIGISASLTIDISEKMAGRRIISLSENYVNAILNAGGFPFILPINNDINVIREYAKILDGLLLSGGYDVDPLNYDEDPNYKLGRVLDERDEFEIKLINEFENLNKPILGICRGNQILNVFHGGTIYQDISLIKGSFIKHDQDAFEYEGTHRITIEDGTKLSRILGKNSLVNSYHHQAIKKVGEGLKIAAMSNDNVIEAIENTTGSFKLGVQWHPEMMFYRSKDMSNIFRYFLLECKNSKNKLI